MKATRFLFALLVLVGLGACDKKNQVDTPAPQKQTAQVKLYRPTAGADLHVAHLQATVISGSVQVSTIGKFNSSGAPLAPDAAYIFDATSHSQAMVLYDAQHNPAFIYGVDVVTGKKKSEVIELERVSTSTLMVRMYSYNWDMRLGTLLLESRATRDAAGNYTFERQFVNTVGTGGRSATGQKSGQPTAFEAPLPRLEQLEKRLVPAKVNDDDVVGRGTTNDMFVANYITPIQNLVGEMRDFFRTVTMVGIGAVLGSPVAGPTAPALAAAGAHIAVVGAVGVIVSNIADSIIRQAIAQHNQIDPDDQTSTFTVNTGQGTTEIELDAFDGYTSSEDGHLQEDLRALFTNAMTRLNDFVRNTRLSLIPNVDLDDLPNSNGVLHFALTWDTATDIDLWVTDPTGTRIYYGNPRSSSGGYLDRDNTVAFGPENIYFRSNIPNGDYRVQVNYYDGNRSSAPTTCNVRVVNGLGYSFARTITLAAEGATATAFILRKAGNTVTAQ